MQMKDGKLVMPETVMPLETDVGSELPLTSFDVTQPGLAAVRVDVLTSSFTP